MFEYIRGPKKTQIFWRMNILFNKYSNIYSNIQIFATLCYHGKGMVPPGIPCIVFFFTLLSWFEARNREVCLLSAAHKSGSSGQNILVSEIRSGQEFHQTHMLPECVYPGPLEWASHQIKLPTGPVLEMDWGN